MTEFWTNNGFYLWALTTALVVIALAWLAWNTFMDPADEAEELVDPEAVEGLQSQVADLGEAVPLMQATLGRSLQFFGLERYADSTGAQAFALAVANARGDGFLLSSSVRGGLGLKPLNAWGCASPLSPEEERAIQNALAQRQHVA